MYQYAIIDHTGIVLVPDAGCNYAAACELSAALPIVNGHSVVNLSWEHPEVDAAPETV